ELSHAIALQDAVGRRRAVAETKIAFALSGLVAGTSRAQPEEPSQDAHRHDLPCSSHHRFSVSKVAWYARIPFSRDLEDLSDRRQRPTESAGPSPSLNRGIPARR